MTPRALTLEALAYIIASGTGNNATIANATTPMLARIASDLTATVQDVYAMFPGIYRRRLGAQLAAPSEITLSCTQDSATVTTSDTFVSGSTVYLDGIFNEIRTENAVKKLLYPYTGSTGSVSATLYNDCVILDSTVDRVIGPVELADTIRLVPRDNRQNFRTNVRSFPDYGRRINLDMTKPYVGQPATFWTEPFLQTAGDNHVSQLLLRVMPLPSRAWRLGYDVRLKAPVYTVAELGTDGADSTATIICPMDAVESTIRPMFLARWAASPWFKDRDAKAAIMDEARAARQKLAEYKAQLPTKRTIRVPV